MYNHCIGRIICGTGHRPNKLGGYSVNAQNIVLNTAYEALEKHDPTLVITGMAQGWDQMLAWASYEMKIPFIAAIPCRGQEKKWTKDAQDKYNFLLSKASRIEYVSEKYEGPWVMQKRNEWMVDRSEIVLALWDGSTTGGTHNCIKYALSKKAFDNRDICVINCWETFEKLKKDNSGIKTKV